LQIAGSVEAAARGDSKAEEWQQWSLFFGGGFGLV